MPLKKEKHLIDKTEFVNVYSTKCDCKEYAIIIPIKTANRRTILHFVDSTIYWEQIPIFPRSAGKQRCYKKPIYKFDTDHMGQIQNTIFVIKGTPLGAEQLDSGIFRSIKKYDENYVNCVTYKTFKKM